MARRWPRFGQWSVAVILILGCAIAMGRTSAVAQRPAKAKSKAEAEAKPEEAVVDAVSLPRNAESKRLIQAAQDYIKKKEWRIAAECLQSLLENPDDTFVEVRRKDARGVDQDMKVSVRDEANRIIGELPADGLESYQIQYGQAAADRLRDAVERADPTLLAEVSQRYLHTKAGFDATNLLGTFHLDRGQYLMAVLCFERLLSRPDADKLPPKITFKAAMAYRRAGDTATAEKLMNRVSEKIGRGDMAFGRVHLSVDQLRAELQRDVGFEPALTEFDWPVFRGNSARNARGQGSTPYLEPHWTISTIEPDEPLDPKDKPAYVWIKQHLEIALQALKDKPILPAFFPVTAGNKLLVRTYDGVSAYALATQDDGTKPGGLLWRSVSADRSLYSTVQDSGKRSGVDAWYDKDYRGGNAGPFGVFFENSVIGTISHDGRRVYYIDDLAVPPHPNMLSQANFGGPVNFAPFNDEVTHNRLYAADIDGGKLSWHALGGKSMEIAKPKDAKDSKEERKPLSAATELLDSFFLGPPLPLGGKLYLLCEKNSELRLICLDPERLVPSPLSANEKVPELLWIQSLGTANTKMANDGFRRLQATHLAYSDGILVCPTNAGAVVGVDLLTHSLVWAFSYRKADVKPTEENMVRFNRWNGRYMNGQPLPERWRPSAPCISKDKIVLTSYDATEIHCLSLRDGRRLWSVPRDEANDLYLGGVFDGRVLIVGRNYVKALDLETGKEIWNRQDTGMPAGQGVAGEGAYFLPVASNSNAKLLDRGPEICALDTKTGNVLLRSKAKLALPGDNNLRTDLPGNLLFAGNELISQSATGVTTFPLLKIRQEEINLKLAKNPKDPGGLTDRGELHLYNGEVPQGVTDLRTALQQQPPADVRIKARSKLYEGLTRWLQSDFPAAESMLNEYEELCKVEIPANIDIDARQKLTLESIRRRATYLELVGKGRERQGRVLDAFAAYEQYGELSGNRELVDSIDEPNTKARPDIWSRGRIQAMIANAKPEDKKLLEAEIARRWEHVRADSNLEGLRRFVSLYGSLSSAGLSARLELATRLIASGDSDDLTEAERLLAAQCYSGKNTGDDAESTAKALDLMIRVCLRRGQYENAVGFYKRLGADFANVVVRDGRTGRELFDELVTDKRFIPYLEAPAVIWPNLQSGREQAANSAPPREVNMTIEPQGELLPFLHRYRLVLNMKDVGHWSLRMIDRLTGEDHWPDPPKLPATKYFNNYQPTAPAAFAQGDNLFLHMNNYVFAFDLVRRKELWRKNLFGNDVLLNSQENNFTIDTDGLMSVSADNRSTPVGRLAIVEATYVALQTREGLVVVDPARAGPSVMWTKSDVSVKARVFGDQQHVFVYDPEPEKNRPRFRILRTADGVAEPIPEGGDAFIKKVAEAFAKKIRIIHGQILVSDAAGKVLRLFDPKTGTDKWRREFTNNTAVVLCDLPNLIGAIEPAGLFTLLDANTGAVEFTSRLRPDHVEKLQQATLITDHDQYYLALNRQADPGLSWDGAVKYGMRSVLLNGPMYALSRRTGKQEWVCDHLANQAILLEQMADLPVLIFASSYARSSGRNDVYDRNSVRVTGVAKSSGKLIFDKDVAPSQYPFHALVPKPTEGKIELIRTDMRMIFSTEPPKPGNATVSVAPVVPNPQMQLRALPVIVPPR